MNDLNYQTANTPRPRFHWFNRLEDALGSAGVICLACALGTLAPVLIGLAVYGAWRSGIARAVPVIIFLAYYPLAILCAPLVVFSLALPPLGTLVGLLGLLGNKKRFALAGMLVNAVLMAAWIVIWRHYGR